MEIDLNSQFVAGVIGALVGAVVGGLISGAISFWLQRKEHKRAEQVRAEERDEERKAIAHSLLSKMLKIHSVIYTALIYLEDVERTRLAEDQEISLAWTLYKRNIATLPNIEFSTAEVGLLHSLEVVLVNEVLFYDHIYRNIIDMVSMLNSMHEALRTEIPARMDGPTAYVNLDDEQVLKFGPKMAQFGEWYYKTLTACRREYDVSEQLLLKLEKVLQEGTGIKVKVQRVPKEDLEKQGFRVP